VVDWDATSLYSKKIDMSHPIAKSPPSERRKRVLFVIGSLEVGGAERHVVQVATRLKERGWNTEVFVLKPGGPLTPTLKQAGVHIYGVQLPQWVSRFIKNDRLYSRIGLLVTSIRLFSILWLRRPYILHFFLPAAYVIGGLVSIFSFVPVQIMSRRSLNKYQSAHPLFARIEHFLHPKMNFVCGNSHAVTKELNGEGVSNERLRFIYNGIDLEPFAKPFDKARLQAELGLAEQSFVFVLVANLIPYKGHTDLIKALGLVKDELPENWVVLCLGRDDGIGASLRQEADSLGLNGRVHFLGSRPDVPNILRISDVGLLCSHEEGFSNAVLEGMAAGLPMVVTDVGGNAEAVIDSVTGFVVPPHNPSVLADALLRVSRLADRKAMGDRGRVRVQEEFSIKACIDGYEALYNDALEGRNSL
jgi:glycosyltransferase involved in cell wall biosynthesis